MRWQTNKRDELFAIEQQAQAKWEDLKVFEIDAPAVSVSQLALEADQPSSPKQIRC